MTALRHMLTAVAILGLVAGCSSKHSEGSPGAQESALLQEVGDLLRASAGAAGRPPARLADLNNYQSMYPHAFDAIKSGDVVVLWGAPMKGEGETGHDEAVVAYEKGAPTNGGFVLLSAGTVKKMSADEFKSAPKAGKKQ